MNNKLLLASLACVASLAPPALAQDADTGRNLAATCAICHGTNGSNSGALPNLAGQPRDALARQMRDFREGKRAATIMHQIAKGYTEQQVDAMAAYFATQKPK
jgi:cytochrome c553